MRLIDADKIGPYDGKGVAYEGDEYFAYMNGILTVLEDIAAAPTFDNFERLQKEDKDLWDFINWIERNYAMPEPFHNKLTELHLKYCCCK